MIRHRQAVAVLALVGFLVALYLWLYTIGVIGALQCGVGDCERVQTSRYADFLGLPVAFYGVAGYAAIFAVSLAGLQPRYLASRGPTRLVAALATIGVLFSVYLTYLELFVIHAICWWCVASAVIIAAIWVVSLVAALRLHQ